MKRSNLVTIHLLLATFFAPMIILMSISGGLYLLGYKGEFTETHEASITGTLSKDAKGRHEEIAKLLVDAGISNYEFEYIKTSGMNHYTRPTSREHFLIADQSGNIEVTRRTPNLIASMVELHKGHGPTLFKTLQKTLALGLLLVMLTGLWLGLANRNTRKRSVIALTLGTITFVVLAI